MEIQTETASKNYDVARAEILQRINLRDRVLLLYIGAVGALFSVALAKNGGTELLVIIPFLAVGAQCLIAQHSIALCALVAYCRYELKPYLESLQENVSDPPQWDASKASLSADHANLWFRTIGETAIIVLPSIVSVTYTYGQLQCNTALQIVWWAAIIATMASFIIAIIVQKLKKRILCGHVQAIG